MGYSARKSANRLHLLGLVQLSMKSLQLANIMIDDDSPFDIAVLVGHRSRIVEYGLLCSIESIDFKQLVNGRYTVPDCTCKSPVVGEDFFP